MTLWDLLSSAALTRAATELLHLTRADADGAAQSSAPPDSRRDFEAWARGQLASQSYALKDDDG